MADGVLVALDNIVLLRMLIKVDREGALVPPVVGLGFVTDTVTGIVDSICVMLLAVTLYSVPVCCACISTDPDSDPAASVREAVVENARPPVVPTWVPDRIVKSVDNACGSVKVTDPVAEAGEGGVRL